MGHWTKHARSVLHCVVHTMQDRLRTEQHDDDVSQAGSKLCIEEHRHYAGSLVTVEWDLVGPTYNGVDLVSDHALPRMTRVASMTGPDRGSHTDWKRRVAEYCLYAARVGSMLRCLLRLYLCLVLCL